MSIRRVNLENITVFKKMEIEFCEGVNVLIGENGTGKTHLLKVLYAFCESKERDYNDYNGIKETFFHFRLLRSFQINSGMDLFRNRSDSEPILISITTGKEYRYEISRHNPKTNVWDCIESSEHKNVIPAVFIPAKDMLTHGGLEKDFADRELPIDITLIDILNKAGVSVLKKLDSSIVALRDKIAGIIGGKVIYKNDKYYIDREGIGQVIFAVEAEGYKKLGLVYRLVETGHIKKGSVLIWDEPDANINPKLIPEIVEIILELSRYGVQVFLATHDYNLMKYFSLKAKTGDSLAFYNLFKMDDGVGCERESAYDLLENNPIIDANTKLLEDEIEEVL